LTKRSKHEREQRAVESARVAEIERAWQASIPADVAAEFGLSVQRAHERGPWERPPDMAPGTRPNPPRPGHEPKVKKDDAAPRRRY
jgi:hypothetical protein